MTPIRLFSSDLDGTLLGDVDSPLLFRAAWASIPVNRRPLLCYNTGWVVEDALVIAQREGLPAPDYVLGDEGAEAWDARLGGSVPDFGERFGHGWEGEQVEDGFARGLPIPSGQDHLNIAPRRASKGEALAWLSRHLGIETGAILVAGDGSNDGSMFRVAGVRGIVVQNAHPALLEVTRGCEAYVASGTFAAGVVEGLRYYGLIGLARGRSPGETR